MAGKQFHLLMIYIIFEQFIFKEKQLLNKHPSASIHAFRHDYAGVILLSYPGLLRLDCLWVDAVSAMHMDNCFMLPDSVDDDVGNSD